MEELAFHSRRRAMLIRLTRSRFHEDLTKSETEVLSDSVRPGPVKPKLDPNGNAVSTDGRRMRADLLRWIVNDRDASSLIDPNGLQIASVTFHEPIDLSNCTISYPLNFTRCHLLGKLELSSASVGGVTITDRSVLEDGINATDLDCGNGFYLDDVKCRGSISFARGKFNKFLMITNCSLVKAHPEDKVLFDAAIVGGDCTLTKTTSELEISGIGAEIRGSLVLRGSHLNVQDASSNALSLDVADIKGELFLDKGFISLGTVRAPHVHIGQDIHADGAVFKGKDPALRLTAADIKGFVGLSMAQFSGDVDLGSARISEQLDLHGAKLLATDDDRGKVNLLLNDISVGQDVRLDGAECSGYILMQGGSVGGDLILSGAKLLEVDIVYATISGDVYWTGIRNTKQTVLNLTGTSFNTLRDERSSWPVSGSLGLDQTKYQNLILYENSSNTTHPGRALRFLTEDRLEWLRRQPEPFTPQPWMQLAKVVGEKGDVAGAKHVQFVYKRLAARSASTITRPFSWVYDEVEENPARITVPIALMWLFGFLVFWRARRMNAMAPTDKAAYERKAAGEPMGGYLPFYPAVYALENVLPVIKLGQDAAWAPNPAYTPSTSSISWRRWLPAISYPWLAAFRWTLIVVGWVLALILAGVVGSRFKA